MTKPFPTAPSDHLGASLRYGLAVGLVLLGLLLRVMMLPGTAGFPFITFFLASTVAFYALGTGPGITAATLGCALGFTLFWPHDTSGATAFASGLALFMYAASTLLVGWIVGKLHRYRLEAATIGQLYERILQEQTDWIARAGADGKLIYVNQAFRRSFAPDQSSLVGTNFDALVCPEELPYIRDELAILGPGNPVVVLENRVRTADGQQRWGQFVIRGSFAVDGRLLEIQSVGRDITRQKELERELSKLAHDMSDLYDNAPCGYHSLSPEGVFLNINKRELEWLGATREQLIGKASITEFLTEEGQAAFLIHHPRLRASGHLEGLEVDLVSRTGETRRVSITANVVRDEDGAYAMSRSILYDVTDRRRAEQAVRELNAELEQRVAARTQELEALNRELEAFSYSVSHDLRTPLRTVHGFSSILIEDFASYLPTEANQHLERIRTAGRSMGELIDGLLAFARLSHVTLTRGPVDNDRLVREALEALRSEWEGRSIDFHIEPLAPCQGDASLLRQVWTNYLSNAHQVHARQSAGAYHGRLLPARRADPLVCAGQRRRL